MPIQSNKQAAVTRKTIRRALNHSCLRVTSVRHVVDQPWKHIGEAEVQFRLHERYVVTAVITEPTWFNLTQDQIMGIIRSRCRHLKWVPQWPHIPATSKSPLNTVQITFLRPWNYGWKS